MLILREKRLGQAPGALWSRQLLSVKRTSGLGLEMHASLWSQAQRLLLNLPRLIDELGKGNYSFTLLFILRIRIIVCHCSKLLTLLFLYKYLFLILIDEGLFPEVLWIL